MKKKGIIALFALMLVCILMFAIACINNKISQDKKAPNFEDVTELSISEVEEAARKNKHGITHQEAETLCKVVLGDFAEETGFPISYNCISAISANSSMYYVMNIAWLVDNHHYSYIGNCFVSYDGEEIFTGTVYDSKYEISDFRWKK